jgi:ADP-ribose pyrophosphatase YjhB (NUDIX family)
MKQTTLSFLVKESEVLLAMKKRGFGVGKWNGVGGKLKENEGVLVAAAREIKEEIGVDVALEDLKNVGTLTFRFDGKPDWSQTCQVFIVREWKGESTESEEMRPQWYAVDKLPFGEMWVDDPLWLPNVLAGQVIDGKFLFTGDGSTLLDHKIVLRLQAAQLS